jgi:hypothetical protein
MIPPNPGIRSGAILINPLHVSPEAAESWQDTGFGRSLPVENAGGDARKSSKIKV